MNKSNSRRRGSLLELKAKRALKKAVANVIKEHKRTGEPLIVWHRGHVARIPASRIKVIGSKSRNQTRYR